MSKKVEVTNVDQEFIDSHEGFTREQVFDKLKQKVKDNNFYCLSKPKSKGTRCMCEQFLMADCEGPCQCGLYTKKLRDTESFEQVRVASLKRQSGKSMFKG